LKLPLGSFFTGETPGKYRAKFVRTVADSDRPWLDSCALWTTCNASCWSWAAAFAFVARQKHVRIEEQDRYIDLIFYHCRPKFYPLIDLKVGELTHADVG